MTVLLFDFELERPHRETHTKLLWPNSPILGGRVRRSSIADANTPFSSARLRLGPFLNKVYEVAGV
jgi:hypothetical protein